MVHLHSYSFGFVFLVKGVGTISTFQSSICLFVFKWEQVTMSIYYHVYLQQYGKYLEVDLISSKAANRKQEKIF